jgi:hypothetical protein
MRIIIFVDLFRLLSIWPSGKSLLFSVAFVISRANAAFMILPTVSSKEIGRQAPDVDFWALVLFGLGNTQIFAIRNFFGNYAALKLFVISFASTPYKGNNYIFLT